MTKNEAKFYHITIFEAKLYDHRRGTPSYGYKRVEIKAADVTNVELKRRRFVPKFKFVYEGPYAIEMFGKFKIGYIVNIKAKPVAYEADVYGKCGKPIHYPAKKGEEGKVRRTTKIKFSIIKIKPYTEEI